MHVTLAITAEGITDRNSPPYADTHLSCKCFSRPSLLFTGTERGDQGAVHSPASGPAVRDTSRATAEATSGVAADRIPNGNSHPSGGMGFYDPAPEDHGPTGRSNPFMSPLQVPNCILMTG